MRSALGRLVRPRADEARIKREVRAPACREEIEDSGVAAHGPLEISRRLGLGFPTFPTGLFTSRRRALAAYQRVTYDFFELVQ